MLGTKDLDKAEIIASLVRKELHVQILRVSGIGSKLRIQVCRIFKGLVFRE